MKSVRKTSHLDGLFSSVSKRHSKCAECGKLVVRNQLLRHTQTEHPHLLDEPAGKKNTSPQRPLRQRNNSRAESCSNGALLNVGNGQRPMDRRSTTISNASPDKYNICLRPRSTSKSLSEVSSTRSSTMITRSSDGTVTERNGVLLATLKNGGESSTATKNHHLKTIHTGNEEEPLVVILDSPSLVVTQMHDHPTSSPSCSTTSTATTLQTESASVRSDEMTVTNGNSSNGTANNGQTTVKRTRKQRTGDNKVTYVDPTSRVKFEDLFYDILPYVSATYTPLANPPMPNLIGVDTNQGWLRNLNTTRLHDFLDLSQKEKEFFALWNAFVSRRVNRAVGRKGLPSLLSRFLDAHQDEVLNRNLMFNFICHCAHLRRCGYISSAQFFDLWMRFEGCGVDFSEKAAQFISSNTTTTSNTSVSVRRQSPRKQPAAQQPGPASPTSLRKNGLSSQKTVKMNVDEQPLFRDRGKNGDTPMEVGTSAASVACNGNGIKRRPKNSHILVAAAAVTVKRSPLKSNGSNSNGYGGGSVGGRTTRTSPIKQL